MRTKKLKKFCSLITAIIICITCIVNISGCKVEDPFKAKLDISSKLLSYIKDNVEALDTEQIYVELIYEETYSTTLEKGTDEYIQDKYMYYKDLNQQRFDLLNLKGYKSYYPGMSSAYVSLSYDSYNAWMLEDYYIVATANPDDLIRVVVGTSEMKPQPPESNDEMKPQPAADVGNLYYPYTKNQMYNDLGIPITGNMYKGDGIKIGILEMALPRAEDIENENYETMLPSNYDISGYDDEDVEYYQNHAYWVYSILGSSTGIVSEADFYFSAFLDEHTLKQAIELLVSSGVDVINMSISYQAGYYKNVSKYIDDVIEETDVIMAISAGNDDISELMNTYATSVNSICVGSTNFDLRSSAFSVSNYGQLNGTYSLLKPTISAPGANIGSFGGLSGFTGTSFSTPIVTGIIAMLMDEFPVLVDHPELVIPLLTNTATKATGQTDIVDEDVGYGIVNYARARQYINNLDDFIMTETYTGHHDAVYETSVYVSSGSKLRITAFVLSEVNNFVYDINSIYNSTTPSFTPIYVTAQNQSTLEIKGGEINSNFSSVEIVNNGSITAEFKIRVYTDVDRNTTEYEHCGIHYIVESAAVKPHEHRYTYSIEQISGNHSLHRWYCSCGSSITEPHTWEAVGTHGAIRCKWCGFETDIMLNGVDKEEVYEK